MIDLSVAKPLGKSSRVSILALMSIVPIAILMSYLASPYVALWRLGEALRSHDCATLRIAIDWDRVRAGLHTEFSGGPAPAISPAVAPAPLVQAPLVQAPLVQARLVHMPLVQTTAATIDPVKSAMAETDDDLPAFGESFASNAVDKALDENVTPEHVSDMLGAQAASQTAGTMGLGTFSEIRHALTWAFFSGPESFDVWVRPGRDLHAEAVRLTMAFTRQHGWRVINVWVPQDLLDPPAPTHST